MYITKNRQSDSTIRQMVSAAFGEKQIRSCTELTEGMCNAAYLLKFTDASKSVLKIAAESDRGRMSNEVNLMEAEVRAMRLVHEAGAVKVAKVQYYDDSHTICTGSYFFMEALEGQSYTSVQESFSEEEKRRIRYETGQVEKNITSIQGKSFGLLGDDLHRYQHLSDFVYQLIVNVLQDAKKKEVVLGVSDMEIQKIFLKDAVLFEEVTQPVLVHWDMWEGNIFVKDKHICGIIDWERAMWGEAFMDDRFRRHTRNQDFLQGYGKEALTQAEMRRIYWYDVLLYLTMMTEGTYREYEDDGQYHWAKTQFEASWRDLQKGQ